MKLEQVWNKNSIDFSISSANVLCSTQKLMYCCMGKIIFVNTQVSYSIYIFL